MSKLPYADFLWPQCSNCEIALAIGQQDWQCPNCGARWEGTVLMDGERATSWNDQRQK